MPIVRKGDAFSYPRTNYLSLNRNKFLEKMLTTDAWSDFLNWELDFCAENACWDGGTHIISVMKKADDRSRL